MKNGRHRNEERQDTVMKKGRNRNEELEEQK
jgi:hypothetical protein